MEKLTDNLRKLDFLFGYKKLISNCLRNNPTFDIIVNHEENFDEKNSFKQKQILVRTLELNSI